MRRYVVAVLVVALVVWSGADGARAQGGAALTVQAATEPPGLDLTATPASSSTTSRKRS